MEIIKKSPPKNKYITIKVDSDTHRKVKTHKLDVANICRKALRCQIEKAESTKGV